MFDEEFSKLTEKEQNQFAHVVNNLMLKSFVLRENYDRSSKIIKTNTDYMFLEKNIELVRDYLQYAGWIIEKDSRLGVIQLLNTNQENKIRIDFMTSLMIYSLRYAYELQREQDQTTEQVYFTASSLLQLLTDKGLIQNGKKPSSNVLASSYRFLENHNIITRIRGDYRDRDMEFYILPSILFIIDNEQINLIFKEIEAENNGGDIL